MESDDMITGIPAHVSSIAMAAFWLVLMGGVAAGAEGKTFHVSPSGSDAASGSENSPWRSIQHAADSLSPGDSVKLHEGTYAERVFFKVSGRASAPIMFSAAPGETVTVKGLELAQGTSYLNITNLDVEGFKFWGVSLEGSNHHVILSGLYVNGGEAAVHFTSEEGAVSDVILENSIIRDPIYTAVDCTPGPCDRVTFRHLEITGAGRGGGDGWGADGIAVERGRNIIVENCHIHDNAGDGIDLNSRDTAGHVSGIVVRRNRIVRNRRNGIKLWAGGRMENNVLWGQGDSAVVLGDWAGTYEVVKNTVAHNMWDASFSERNYSLVAAYPSE